MAKPQLAKPHLPEEILIEIFSRLPTKSVGKFRCLSLEWRTLLSTPRFIELHSNRKIHQEHLIFTTLSDYVYTVAMPSKMENKDLPSRQIQLPKQFLLVAGSCKGLVLLLPEEDELLLLNPITLQQVSIPDADLDLSDDEKIRMHGLGYDSSSDDFKIVTVSLYDHKDYNATSVHLYSVKRGVWERVAIYPYDRTGYGFSLGAFVNGVIHWLKNGRESVHHRPVIAAFGLADKTYNEIPVPTDFSCAQDINGPFILGGCLCMVHGLTDIWLMKKYGLVESWIKLRIHGDFVISKPLCFIRDEEIVLQTEEGPIVVYNLKDEILEYMTIHEAPDYFWDGGTFLESLVSPN